MLFIYFFFPILFVQIVAKHWTVKGEYPVGPCADVVPDEAEAEAAAAASASAEVEVSADGSTVANTNTVAEKLVLGEEGGRIHLDSKHDGVEQTNFEYLYGRFGGPRPKTTRELVWADPPDACSALENAEEVCVCVCVCVCVVACFFCFLGFPCCVVFCFLLCTLFVLRLVFVAFSSIVCFLCCVLFCALYML